MNIVGFQGGISVLIPTGFRNVHETISRATSRIGDRSRCILSEWINLLNQRCIVCQQSIHTPVRQYPFLYHFIGDDFSNGKADS